MSPIEPRRYIKKKEKRDFERRRRSIAKWGKNNLTAPKPDQNRIESETDA